MDWKKRSNGKFFVSEHVFNTPSQIYKDNNNKYITRTYFISHTSWEFFENAFIAVAYTEPTTKKANQDEKERDFPFNFYDSKRET